MKNGAIVNFIVRKNQTIDIQASRLYFVNKLKDYLNSPTSRVGTNIIPLRNLQQFVKDRPEQYNAAKQVANQIKAGHQFILLYGDLKAGKREVVITTHLLLAASHQTVYALALSRRDMQDQINEFESYSIPTLIISQKQQRTIKNFSTSKRYVVFVDESDYGDNENQGMEEFINSYTSYSNVQFVFTSATPHSLLTVLAYGQARMPVVVLQRPSVYSCVSNLRFKEISMDPLSYQDKDITQLNIDFKSALKDWLKTDYTKFIVRDINFQEHNKVQLARLIEPFCKAHNLPVPNIILVDKDNKYNWKSSNCTGRDLIIVKQTFVRGTETNMHRAIYGYYDARDKSALNTMLQAVGRLGGNVSNRHIKIFGTSSLKEYIDIYAKMSSALRAGEAPENVYNQFKDKKIILSLNTSIHNKMVPDWRPLFYDNTPVNQQKLMAAGIKAFSKASHIHVDRLTPYRAIRSPIGLYHMEDLPVGRIHHRAYIFDNNPDLDFVRAQNYYNKVLNKSGSLLNKIVVWQFFGYHFDRTSNNQSIFKELLG